MPGQGGQQHGCWAVCVTRHAHTGARNAGQKEPHSSLLERWRSERHCNGGACWASLGKGLLLTLPAPPTAGGRLPWQPPTTHVSNGTVEAACYVRRMPDAHAAGLHHKRGGTGGGRSHGGSSRE